MTRSISSAASAQKPAVSQNGDPTAPIKLLIVDGHPVTRWGLARLAADQPNMEILAETGSAADALHLADALDPDVVTIGISLIDGNGLALARDLRDRYADLGIVILTSHGEDDILFRALETGVSAFVSKMAPLPEIIAAIRHAAAASSSFTCTGLAQALRRREETSERMTLSPREREVLDLLQLGRSVPDIAATLYISLSTAKTYVARLYEKLGATNRATALMTAVRFGLIHQPNALTG